MKKMQGADNLGIFSSNTSVTNQKGYDKPAWFENLWGRTPANPKPTKPQDIELGAVNQHSKSSSLWSSWRSQDIETSTAASNDGNNTSASSGGGGGISGMFGSFTAKVN